MEHLAQLGARCGLPNSETEQSPVDRLLDIGCRALAGEVIADTREGAMFG